jgi:hypothetical protein
VSLRKRPSEIKRLPKLNSYQRARLCSAANDRRERPTITLPRIRALERPFPDDDRGRS